MIDLTIDASELADLRDQLGEWSRVGEDIDLHPLASTIADQIVAENRKLRWAGTDGDGDPLTPLRPITIQKRGNNNPAFIPHGVDSRVIANLSVKISVEADGLNVVASLPGCGWLRFHIEGAGRLPVRDITGFSPAFHEWLEDVVSEYVRLRLIEQLDGQTTAEIETFSPITHEPRR